MSSDGRDKVLRRATFDPKVKTYWLLSGALVCVVTIAGIVLLPFWFLLGNLVTSRYLRHLRCVLTERSLQVSKGMFVRVEKTIPLDKITDLGLVEGPIMRHFGLAALTVETAGQSSQGSLVRLIGVEDTRGFRKDVLAQRDRVVASLADQSAPVEARATLSEAPNIQADEVLADIRDTLHRIEEKIGNK